MRRGQRQRTPHEQGAAFAAFLITSFQATPFEMQLIISFVSRSRLFDRNWTKTPIGGGYLAVKCASALEEADPPLCRRRRLLFAVPRYAGVFLIQIANSTMSRHSGSTDYLFGTLLDFSILIFLHYPISELTRESNRDRYHNTLSLINSLELTL